MVFYLGTHRPNWLALTDVPLFVSHRRLAGRRSLPRALGTWCLDSGGFSELSLFGEWRTSEDDYAAAMRRYIDEIGNLQWAAPQDWMCEPFMLAKTGLSIQEHQRRSVLSYLKLRDRGLPVIPVLQGWQINDYLRCVSMFSAEGVDLEAEPVVGVGSVCRRQGTWAIEEVMATLAGLGLRLHGFGVKLRAFERYAEHLVSADSMAWSYQARREAGPMPGCSHRKCANCLRYALRWRARVVLRTATYQTSLGLVS